MQVPHDARHRTISSLKRRKRIAQGHQQLSSPLLNHQEWAVTLDSVSERLGASLAMMLTSLMALSTSAISRAAL